MSTEPTPAFVPIAAPLIIETDMPCFFCGYNLRTLSLSAVCPECGNEIQEGYRRGWLNYADPDWLRKLRTGVTIPLWMILGGVVSYLGLMIWMGIVMARAFAANPNNPPFPDLGSLFPALILLALAQLFGWLVSIWKVTTPEPVPKELARGPRLAFWIRLLSVISSVLGMLLVLVSLSFLPSFPNQAPSIGIFQAVVLTLSLPNGIIGSIAFFLLLVHMRRIARRSVKKGLAKLMTVFIWGGVGFVGLWLLYLLAMSFATPWMLTPPAGTTAGTWPPATTMPSAPATKAPRGSSSQPVKKTTNMSEAEDQADDGDMQMVDFSTTSPSTSMPVTAMPAGGPPFPFSGSGVPIIFVACLVELAAFAWFITGIMSLFWFRRMFTQAIQNNARHMLPSA